MHWLSFLSLLVIGCSKTYGHEAKDFDDSVLYTIDFEIPDFEKEPDLNTHLKTFYTHDQEKYDCLIPVVENKKEKTKYADSKLPPLLLLHPTFISHSCSYRIEAYWSYEICHGRHVRQYHEEREGKNTKSQEYYLGRWNSEKVTPSKLGPDHKYKTTKIDNTKYPYFEIEMGDGTMCDIINAPRTTVVRYVCNRHGNNDIYSFKETSSCNYEAIILTSALCINPDFYPEESKEISIKCFSSRPKIPKPLGLLTQELNEAAETLVRTAMSEKTYSSKKLDFDKIVSDIIENEDYKLDFEEQEIDLYIDMSQYMKNYEISDILPALNNFFSETNCLTGGTGWWKYEFCFGRHVRQLHRETELYLGYFSEEKHKEWKTKQNSYKRMPRESLWHHYTDGTICDRTGLPREVNVKMECMLLSAQGPIISMYLLEPLTCKYILVVESPIICELLDYADEYDLINKNVALEGIREKHKKQQEEKQEKKETTANEEHKKSDDTKTKQEKTESIHIKV